MQASQQRRVLSVHSEIDPVSDVETGSRHSDGGERSVAATPSLANLLQLAPTQLASVAVVAGAFDDADEDVEVAETAMKPNLTQHWQPQNVWAESENDYIPTSVLDVAPEVSVQLKPSPPATPPHPVTATRLPSSAQLLPMIQHATDSIAVQPVVAAPVTQPMPAHEVPELVHRFPSMPRRTSLFSTGPSVAPSKSKSWFSGLLDSVLDYVDPASSAYSQVEQFDVSRAIIPAPSSPAYGTTSSTATDNDTSIPDHHFQKALAYLEQGQLLLASTEFTLAATLGPDPHPEAMRNLIEMYNSPNCELYDPDKAIEWTSARLMVLGTPEGMLSQARFLRGGGVSASSSQGGFGRLGYPPRRWFTDERDDMEAALLIRQAAEAGYPPALHAYAVYLQENGRGNDALIWFGKAVERGVWESGRWIVDAYERGTGGATVNRALADKWRKKVEEKEAAMQVLAEVKRREDEEMARRYRDEADALAIKKMLQEKRFKVQEEEAKNRREIDGSYNNTLKYLGWGYYMLAIDELCKLANAGNVDAAEFTDPDISLMPRDKPYSGAAMFCFGEYFAKRGNASYAARWYRNAAEIDHADAQVTYAAYLITGKGMECEDPGQSVVWLMKAWSCAKHKEAAMALGDAFTKGIGVAPDPSKALTWYQRAWYEGQFIEAAFAVGLAYATGYTPGYAKPIQWNLAGGGGDVVQHADPKRLGAAPVRRSYEKAVEWYELAAKFGHARSCNNLGEMYMMGRGVARNDYIGISYFRRAAEQGLPEAKYNVGRCYRDGRGCRRDERAAIEWFKQAEDAGVKEATLAIEESSLNVATQ